jgi:hypothetical protein
VLIPLDLFQPYLDKPDALGRRRRTVEREIRQAVVRVLVFSTSVVYNCNIVYKILETEIWSGIGEAATTEERNENENSDLHD